jgi:hypothetical protein
MAYHEIQPNQTLAELVAAVAPYLDAQTVRQHEKNQQLFGARDEYVLKAGDPVWIPEEEPKYEWHQVASGETVTLEVMVSLRQFKLTLLKPNRDPVADQAFVLEVDGRPFEGTTDAAGLIDIELPFDATQGVLQVGKFRYKLAIGGLDPLHTISGIQARLANLGFEPGPIDGIVGARTTGAVEAFQAHRQLDESGVVDEPTRKALLEAYGC